MSKFGQHSSISYEDFTIICRICLDRRELKPFQRNLLKTYINLLQIEISEDENNFPNNICKTCLKILDDIADFIEKAKCIEASLNRAYCERLLNTADSSDNLDKDDTSYPSNLSETGKQSEIDKSELSNLHHDKRTRQKKKSKSNSRDNILKCELCSKFFYGKSSFANHRRMHKYKREKKEFLCSVCGKNFIKNSHLERHMITHTGIKPFICKECGKSFGQNNDLKRHYLTHTREKVFQCTQCNKGFHQKSCLDNHILTHTNERNFQCHLCEKKFNVKAYLEVHMRTHTGLKPFCCPHCDKQFYQKGGLNNHILTHTGEKPYKCTQCEKTFIQSNHLKEHSRIHSGEKPFICSYCGKACAYRSTLKVHLRQHTGETPYTCSFCDMGFHDASNLRRHINRHHTNSKDAKMKIESTVMQY